MYPNVELSPGRQEGKLVRVLRHYLECHDDGLESGSIFLNSKWHINDNPLYFIVFKKLCLKSVFED